jgi:hypothetical protein
MDTSRGSYPTKENNNVLAALGTVIVKVPSSLDCVPVEEFLMVTDTPGSGTPFLSVTLPVTVLDCAHALPTISNSHMAVRKDCRITVSFCLIQNYPVGLNI